MKKLSHPTSKILSSIKIRFLLLIVLFWGLGLSPIQAQNLIHDFDLNGNLIKTNPRASAISGAIISLPGIMDHRNFPALYFHTDVQHRNSN